MSGINLTKTGIQSGMGPAKFFNSPEEALAAANDILSKVPPAGLTIVPSQLSGVAAQAAAEPPASAPVDPSTLPGATPMAERTDGVHYPGMGPAPVAPVAPPDVQFSGGGPQMTAPDTSAIPHIFRPTFQQASTDASGNPRAFGPGLSKMGSLLVLLKAAAEGGAAGMGARTVGEGFARAQALPMQRQQLAQEQAQTAAMQQTQQQNNQPVQTPSGPIPYWMAQRLNAQKQADAALASTQAETNLRNKQAANVGNDQEKNLTPAQLYATTVRDAMDNGLSGDQLRNDPKVQASLKAYQDSQKAEKPDTPMQQYLDAAAKGDKTTMGIIEQGWHAQAAQTHITNSPTATRNINGRVMQFNPDSHRYDIDLGAAGGSRGSGAQFNSVADKKKARLDALEKRFRWNPTLKLYQDNESTRTLTPDEWDAQKQQIQDLFEQGVENLGGDANRFSYGAASNVAKPNRADATATAKNPQTGKAAYLVGGKWFTEDQVQ